MSGIASSRTVRNCREIGGRLIRIKAGAMPDGDCRSMVSMRTNGIDNRQRQSRRWSLFCRVLAVFVAVMLVLSPIAGGSGHAMHASPTQTMTDHSHGHDGAADELTACCHAAATCAAVFLISADQSTIPLDANAMIFEMFSSLLEGRESVPDLQPPTT